MKFKKILLIEDDLCVIVYSKKVIGENSLLQLSVASTIEKAIECINNEQFDMIFLDGDLDVFGPRHDNPQTKSLYPVIKEKQPQAKLFCISGHFGHCQTMQDEFGIPRLDKTNVAPFVLNFYNSLDSVTLFKPSINSISLEAGKLVVVMILENDFVKETDIFIAEIVDKQGLALRIVETYPLLTKFQYMILEKESCMIQGTLKEQNDLLHNSPKKVQTGLTQFGGFLKEITEMPIPVFY